MGTLTPFTVPVPVIYVNVSTSVTVIDTGVAPVEAVDADAFAG
jgi:hypothetical protein